MNEAMTRDRRKTIWEAYGLDFVSRAGEPIPAKCDGSVPRSGRDRSARFAVWQGSN